MKLPRNVSGRRLATSLGLFGYVITRQTGSHIRLTTLEQGEHHLTIPDHPALRVGTLGAILNDVGDHSNMSRDEVIEKLDL